MKKKMTFKSLLAKGIPAVLIPGIIFASIYGVKNLDKLERYQNDKRIFPVSGIVEEVEDGDTFSLESGQVVRMTGINAADRGEDGYVEAGEYLRKKLESEKVYLEYDRYQDDKYGRILAWVWINCETDKPKFSDWDYMRVNRSESRPYITEKPEGCKKGELVNESLVEEGMAVPLNYESRGRLKYEL